MTRVSPMITDKVYRRNIMTLLPKWQCHFLMSLAATKVHKEGNIKPGNVPGELNNQSNAGRSTYVILMARFNNIAAIETLEFLTSDPSLNILPDSFFGTKLPARGGTSMSKDGDSPKVGADGYQPRLLVWIYTVSFCHEVSPMYEASHYTTFSLRDIQNRSQSSQCLRRP